MMHKAQIDRFFSENWHEIERVILNNAFKSKTKNICSVASDVYVICLERKKDLKKENILGFIGVTASNLYSWDNGNHNITNRSICNDIPIPDIYIQEEESNEEEMQRLNYALRKYYVNAEPHEKIFFNIYVYEGIRSIRPLIKRLDITFRGANILINDFKQKVKQYEREIQTQSEKTTSANGTNRTTDT